MNTPTKDRNGRYTKAPLLKDILGDLARNGADVPGGLGSTPVGDFEALGHVWTDLDSCPLTGCPIGAELARTWRSLSG